MDTGSYRWKQKTEGRQPFHLVLQWEHMNSLECLPFVKTYMDDVLIHSGSEEICSSHLEQVLHRLQKAGLTLRGNKCQIGLPEVAFLGHVFSGAGVMPDNAKVKTVQDTAKKVQQFLGLASY